MTLGDSARYALVTSLHRAFDAAVAARLRVDGVTVVEDVAALPAGAALDRLVIDQTMTSHDVPFRAVTDDQFRASLDGQLYALTTDGDRMARFDRADPFSLDEAGRVTSGRFTAPREHRRATR